MIVIATNNGIGFLPPLLSSLEQFGPHDQKILIVDTGSTDPEFLDYLTSLQHEVIKTPYIGYDTGAYIWAYQNYLDDEYMFMHDSLVIKESGWMDTFRNKWNPDYGLVAWMSFNGVYDNEDQKTFLELYLGTSETDWGVFGPIFYTTRIAMEKMKPYFLIPNNKNEQMAMERGWAVICNKLGLGWDSLHPHDHHKILADELPYLRKHLPRRN